MTSSRWVPEAPGSKSDVRGNAEIGLADQFREGTRELHSRAERSGIVREILRGRADRHGYSLFLRNLLPAYHELETGLQMHREAPGVRWLFEPEVFRAGALESDLASICGVGWERHVPLLPSGQHYAQRVADVARHAPARLIAHAYVRYFGDLSGGQVLRQLLSVAPGLGAEALSFYSFPLLGDLHAFKRAYRNALNRAGLEVADWESLVDEARAAFHLNIELAEAVRVAAPRQG
jgi:heme oxygenase (biliverdin-producing, ferredoxin)